MNKYRKHFFARSLSRFFFAIMDAAFIDDTFTSSDMVHVFQ